MDQVGLSGGLALMWKHPIDILMKQFSMWHIHANVNNGAATQWQCTNFYGHLEVGKGHDTWNLLTYLYTDEEILWLVCGDFNQTLNHDEK